MNALKSICTTAILTLLLAASVAAGEITTPGYTPPPPPPPPELNITVDLCATPRGASSDQETLSTSEVVNILWFLASIF